MLRNNNNNKNKLTVSFGVTIETIVSVDIMAITRIETGEIGSNSI